MADRYAVGTGNWNDTSTWAASSGGSTGESVPVDGDNVYFDANSGTVTLNAAARCDRITFNGGGTLDTDSSNDYAFTVDEQMYLQSGGTFNANGSTIKIGDGVVGSEYTLKAINGTFNGGDGIHTIGSIKVNGGTLNLSAGTTTINGAESSSSAGCLQKTSAGTLAHNNGTVIFDVQNYGGSIILLYGGDITLYRVYLDATASNQRLKLWGNGATSPRRKLTVAHNLTIRGGTFRTQHSTVEECDLDVGGDLLLEPSASAGTDVKAQFESYDAVVNVSGKLETRGTWYSAGSNYTPKSIYNGGTGTHSYQGINFLVGTDVTLSSGVTSITGAIGGTGAGTAFRSDVQNSYNTYSNGSGTVKFTNSNDQHLYSTGQQADNFTQFHNLILEKTSSTLQGLTTVGFHIKVGNDLTITSGILDTNTTNATNHDLTVLGGISIASGATLNCNASTITNGSSSSNASDFDPAGNLTLGSCTFKYFCGSSGNIYLSDATLASNTSTLELIGMQTFSGRDMDFSTSSGNLHNLTVTKTGSVTSGFRLTHNTTLGGNLTIETGATLDTNTSNKSLTVAGEIKINGGTLTCNASDVICRNIWGASGTLSAPSNSSTNGLEITGKQPSGGLDNSNYSMYFVGTTLTNNDGLIVLSADENTFIRMPQVLANFKIRNDGSSSTRTHEFTMNFECDHDLTLENGTFQSYGTTQTLTIGDDVLITKGTLGRTSNTAAYSFGSLSIASEGIYIATSGTTTITTGGTIAGTAEMAFGGEGTFTHNNGTLVLDSTLHRIPTGGTFYNLTLNGEQNADGIYGYTTTLLPQGIMPDGTTGAAYMSILGTLQINNDEFRPYNIDKIYIHNLIIGDGTGSANSAKFDMSEIDTFDGTVFVDNVTINSDGQLLFGDGDETSSTAGSSALNIYGAFRNLGGSVDIT
jgi:hypothetical protein